MTTSDTSPSGTWALWLLIIVLFSTLIAVCVAIDRCVFRRAEVHDRHGNR
ncbi:hypothetical protein ACFYRD_08660 [Streptomyces hirsutus]